MTPTAPELISRVEALNLLVSELCVRESLAQTVLEDGVREEHLHPLRVGPRTCYRRRDVLGLVRRVAQDAPGHPDPDAAYKAALEDAIGDQA